MTSPEPTGSPAGEVVVVESHDNFAFKVLLILLILSCSVTLVPLYFGASANHASLIYPDAPIVFILATLAFFLILLGNLKIGKANFVAVLAPFWLLTIWWGISGLLWAKKTDFFIASWLQYFVGITCMTVTPWIIRHYGLNRFSIKAIQWGGIGVSIGGIVQGVIRPEAFFEDVTSTLGPNHAQIGLYMMAVLAACLFQLSEERSRLALTAAILSFLTIMISGSRASQIGIVPILGIFMFKRFSFMNIIKFSIVLILVFGVLSYIVKKRASYRNQSTEFVIHDGVKVDKSSGRRLLMWVAAWDVIQSSTERATLGIGYSNFRWEYGHLIRLPFYTNAAHNAYLHIWTESGLIGLILYLWTYAGLIRASWRRRKLHSGALVLAGLMLGTMVTALTQETLYTNEAMSNINVFFLFTCIVILAATHQGLKKVDADIAKTETL